MINNAPNTFLSKRCRRGFTLIELLVTISVLGILISTILFAMAAATEGTKASKTKTTIALFHNLLMERWESYQTRRVPIAISGSLHNFAGERLKAIRDIMRMDFPDRWDNVTNAPKMLSERTALSSGYLRYYNRIKAKTGSNPTNVHQAAECLYMVLTINADDLNPLEFLRSSDIGDVDNDGAPEFLDGWGKPIQFIRWPAGFKNKSNKFVSEKQYNTPDPVNDDHDPFDFRKTDDKAYRLVPLIYSAGPDGIFDIANEKDAIQNLNPYSIPASATQLLGTPIDNNNGGGPDGDENWHDNITNHLISTR